jgi:hypothetical membrane protein
MQHFSPGDSLQHRPLAARNREESERREQEAELAKHGGNDRDPFAASKDDLSKWYLTACSQAAPGTADYAEVSHPEYWQALVIQTTYRLWFGPVATLVFLGGMFAIGSMIPNYSHIRQTVSELGEVGSPGRLAFSVLLSFVAVCLLVFASGVASTLRETRTSTLPAYFIGSMAVSAAGVGIFAFPHPLHNVFGMSELIGYQAPLMAALVSKTKPKAEQLSTFSVVMYILVLLAIAANLTTLNRSGMLFSHIRPFYGVVQRLLFAGWFVWCAGYGLLLMHFRQKSVAVYP